MLRYVLRTLFEQSFAEIMENWPLKQTAHETYSLGLKTMDNNKLRAVSFDVCSPREGVCDYMVRDSNPC